MEEALDKINRRLDDLNKSLNQCADMMADTIRAIKSDLESIGAKPIGKPVLTKAMLYMAQNRGKVIYAGTTENSPNGIFMSRDGGMLRWVVKIGVANDWAMYVDKEETTDPFVAQHGNKIMSRYNASMVIDFDDDVWDRYRL